MSDTETNEDRPKAFPVPLGAFVKTLKGTEDEVWARVLAMRHARENHTVVEWHGLLNAMRTEPVTH